MSSHHLLLSSYISKLVSAVIAIPLPALREIILPIVMKTDNLSTVIEIRLEGLLCYS